MQRWAWFDRICCCTGSWQVRLYQNSPFFQPLHSRRESAKGGKRFMPRASYVLTLPSLRAESIREKKWSQRGELETIGHNGFCNLLLRIKRNPTYLVIIYISKGSWATLYDDSILSVLLYCKWVKSGSFVCQEGPVRGERVTVPSTCSCLKQPFLKPACQAFEEEK